MAGLIGSIRCSSSISLDCRLKPKDMLQKLRPLPVLRTPSRPTNSSSRKAQTFVGKLYPQTDSRSLVPAYFLAVREWGRAWHTTPREVISWSRMNGNTDDAGRFVFEHVPEGTMEVFRVTDFHEGMSGVIGWSHVTKIQVAAAGTNEVTFGGFGRQVIGRIRTSLTNTVVDWKRDL